MAAALAPLCAVPVVAVSAGIGKSVQKQRDNNNFIQRGKAGKNAAPVVMAAVILLVCNQ